MGLLDKVLGKDNPDKLAALVAEKGFEVSSCDSECSTCEVRFPASVKVDNAPLWESTSPYGLHVVVATGKTDWPHDATGTSHTIAHQAAKWGEKTSGKYSEIGTIKVTCSSLSTDKHTTNQDYIDEKRGDILLLPFFVWVRNVELDKVSDVLSSVVSNLVEARNKRAEPKLEYPEYPEVSVEIDTNKAHVFLCSHRTRDKRCGITAPIMKKEMDIYLRELEMLRDHGDTTPGGVSVSFINHIGGHKYSANVLIYLRESGKNIWLARCTPANCQPIIDECIVNGGKVWPEKVRIIQKYNPISW